MLFEESLVEDRLHRLEFVARPCGIVVDALAADGVALGEIVEGAHIVLEVVMRLAQAERELHARQAAFLCPGMLRLHRRELCVALLLALDLRQQQPCARHAGIDRQRLAGEIDGLVELALFHHPDAQSIEQVGIPGTNAQCLAEDGNGLVQAACFLQRLRQPDAGPDMERIAPDRAAIDILGALELAELLQRGAEIVARRELIRAQRNRLAETIDGGLDLAEVAQHRAEIVVEVGIVRQQPHRLLDQRQPLGATAALV